MEIILSISCSFLIAAGLLFILIDIYTKYDVVFRYIGLNLVILALMAGLDIWIMPSLTTMDQKLYWQRILHIMTGFVAFIFVKQVSHLTKRHMPRMERFIFFLSIVIGLLVLTTNMLQIKGSSIDGNWMFGVFYFPYVLLVGFLVCYPLYKRIRLKIPGEKKILNFQLYGILILVFFGCLDMSQFLKPVGSNFPDYKTFGILVYGFMSALIFAEHFLALLKERDANKKRLETAYADLQQSNALRQLGESTAIINHEIKNYMFMISGNAQLMQEMHLVSGKAKELLGNIVSSVERLQNFSQDILELSRTHILQNKKSLNLSALIRDVIQDNFSDKQESIDLHGLDRDYEMPGDWDKLHQVFTNLLGNAFDAAHSDEALEIKVRVSSNQSVILVTIEDNGIGCNEDQLKNMFKAFFTTKIGRKGTGLGLSISRTIIESHGGHISVYSKNLVEGGNHGVKFQISFPNFTEEMAKEFDRKSPIMVIKEGLPNIAGIIRVFQNVYIAPYFVQNVNELLQQNFQRKAVTVIASGETIKHHFAKLKESFAKVCLLSEQKGSLYIYDFGSNKSPLDFSEEYVLQQLVSDYILKSKIEKEVPETVV